MLQELANIILLICGSYPEGLQTQDRPPLSAPVPPVARIVQRFRDIFVEAVPAQLQESATWVLAAIASANKREAKDGFKLWIERNRNFLSQGRMQ